MAYTVNILQNLSPDYQLDKNFNNLLVTTALFKGGSGIEDIEIDIQTSVDLSQANYMYIPELSRYYFITSIATMRNDYYRLIGHVDVLSTYKTQIRSNNAIIRRQEHLYNKYLDDEEFKTLNKSQVITRRFSTGAFTKSMKYVLVTAGG